jgi:hypothetical protein
VSVSNDVSAYGSGSIDHFHSPVRGKVTSATKCPRESDLGDEVSDRALLPAGGGNLLPSFLVERSHDRRDVAVRRYVVLQDHEAEPPRGGDEHVAGRLIKTHDGVATGENRRRERYERRCQHEAGDHSPQMGVQVSGRMRGHR